MTVIRGFVCFGVFLGGEGGSIPFHFVSAAGLSLLLSLKKIMECWKWWCLRLTFPNTDFRKMEQHEFHF